MNLHAISVVAPAGDWVANKKKTIEVRPWLPETVPLLNVAIIQNEHYLLEDGQADGNGYLLATGDAVLTHDYGQVPGKKQSLPVEVFCQIVTEIRCELSQPH